MPIRSLRLAGALAGVALIALGAAPVASADTLSCGARVSRSVVLDNDVTCFADPIVITRGGVTLDLNGHTINQAFGDGVRSLGHTRVTIENGTIVTEGRAVNMTGSRNRLLHLQGFGDAGGLHLSDGRYNEISGVDFGRGIGPGAVLVDQRDARVTRSRIDLLELQDVDDSTVRDNRATTIAADDASDGNVLSYNRNAGDRAYLEVAGDGNRIVGNQYSGAYFAAADILVGGDDNLVQGNAVTDAQRDGLDVEGTGNRVGGNVARDNGALGIFAADGNADAGGNRASGNGDPRQCAGVTCAP